MSLQKEIKKELDAIRKKLITDKEALKSLDNIERSLLGNLSDKITPPHIVGCHNKEEDK